MYPTAYTLTVLVLTLLQYSFDKRYAKNACQNGSLQRDNSTLMCQQNVLRKEIRQLNRREFDGFVQVFNEYSTRNDTDELNANINELGVVQIFDELLQSKQMLTPYWEYRLELSADKPETSSLWTAKQFQAVNQANDAQWLIEFIENENNVDDDEFFDDDLFSKLWKRRREALKVMRSLKQTDVFWHLLLLVSIETGIDQNEFQINRTSCIRDFGKFTRWSDDKCQVSLRDGEQCKNSGDCYNRRCSKNQCASTKKPSTNVKLNLATTTQPINNFLIPDETQLTTTEALPTIEQQNSTELIELNGLLNKTEQQSTIDTTEFLNDLSLSSNQEQVDVTTTTELPREITTAQQNYRIKLKPPPDHQQNNSISNAELTKNQTTPQWNAKMAVTTEFLANELTTASSAQEVNDKNRRKKKKLGKKNRKKLTTTVEPHEQIPATELYIEPTLSLTDNGTQLNNESNSPIEQESYNTDTLDALLVYLPTPKVPAMISWTSNTPLNMAYFSFTIIEGPLGKQRRLKEKGHRRAKGARIYLRGLGMPNGYSQITQGRQMKSGILAMARTLNPNDNEPFVEFKMRVENRYGTPCKQMCLDSHQRYRRCARRTIRLSPYKKFSDPVPYYDSEILATNAQYAGRGYYKKRRLSYLLFKCE